MSPRQHSVKGSKFMVYIVESFIGMTVQPEFTFEGQKRESSLYK